MEESSKSIQEQVDFWLNDKRVLKIMNDSKNNVFVCHADPKKNPAGFLRLVTLLDKCNLL